MPAKTARLFWRTCLLLTVLAGAVCITWLLGTPSESSRAILLGFSLELLILIGILLLVTLTSAVLAWRAFVHLDWLTTQHRKLEKFASKPSAKAWLVGGVLVLVFSWILFFVSSERAIQWFGSSALYLERLAPAILFAISALLIWLPFFALLRFGFAPVNLAKEIPKARLGLIIFASLLISGGLIAITGLGLGFDATVWNAPGAPLLAEQVFICLLVTPFILVAVFWMHSKLGKKQIGLDLSLAVLVWLVASFIWLSQPAQPTYYETGPLPPNNQSYPLSDAFNHDVIANNVLIGEGFRFGSHVAIRRPVYVLFLAGLEGLFGGNYDAVVASQVVVLAMFPAALYLVGANLSNRFAGLFMAGIVTLREANSIALGHVANMSHAKMLMADLPTALFVSLLALAIIRWLRNSPSNLIAPLLVGGLLGAGILLRSQSLTLVPFIALLAVLVWGWRLAWKQMALFALGTILVAMPWIARNKVLMGQWAIEDAVVSGFLANRYSFTPGTFGLPFLDGESEGEYYARQMNSVREFALANPLYVVGFVTDNYVRNEMLNVMALPLSLELRDAEAQVRELPYWPGWQGELAAETMLPLLGGIALVGLGLAVAWKQSGWIGLVPLFLNFGFTFNLALARVSGWRYNLPVDWTVLLYFAIGLAQIVVWSLMLLRAKWTNNFLDKIIVALPKPKKSHLLLPNVVSAAAFLLLAGSSFLIIEALGSPRYSGPERAEVEMAVHQSELGITNTEDQRETLLALLAGDELNTLAGRALHPRYYHANDGLVDRDFALVALMDFERLTFYVIGPEPASVVLPIDTARIEFPASSDVLVLRCGLEAVAAIVKIQETSKLYISPELERSCGS